MPGTVQSTEESVEEKIPALVEFYKQKIHLIYFFKKMISCSRSALKKILQSNGVKSAI